MKIMPFDILNIDLLGQGVSKIGDKISFISKTLVGEQGEMLILHENNKLCFGKIKTLTKSSPERITPKCKHFEECGGCDYLHTNYQQEIIYKKTALEWLSKSLPKVPNTTLHLAPERDSYRNRSQFHYDLKKEIIGYKIKKSHHILPIENCLLLKKDLQEFYKTLSLKEIAKKKQSKFQENTGHFEISQLGNGPVTFHLNERYATQGFTQVNETMNQILKDLVYQKAQQIHERYHWEQNAILFDLFGGMGNLSEKLDYFHTFVVDSFTPKNHLFKKHQQFINCNLFNPSELKKIYELPRPHIVFIDPPRSGFKDLKKIVETLKPHALIYVSCEPMTLIRDIREICDIYHFDEFHLIDLFPSTRHFETMAIFSLK